MLRAKGKRKEGLAKDSPIEAVWAWAEVWAVVWVEVIREEIWEAWEIWEVWEAT
jgi:hypothetical protein